MTSIIFVSLLVVALCVYVLMGMGYLGLNKLVNSYWPDGIRPRWFIPLMVIANKYDWLFWLAVFWPILVIMDIILTFVGFVGWAIYWVYEYISYFMDLVWHQSPFDN